MPIQIPTTGQLEDAQNIVLGSARFTQEHNAPMRNLVEHHQLEQGAKQMTIPKVGQMTADDLTSGVDMETSQDIGMTVVDLTVGEVGLLVILDDTLVVQANDPLIAVVGVQMGDAMARKENRDLLALLSALNGGTTLGADNTDLTARNAGSCIAFARANKFPGPIAFVHHPNAIFALTSSLAPVGATASVQVPTGFSQDLLSDFFSIRLSGIPFFETGDIDVIGATASAFGGIFSKHALASLDSMAPRVEPQRDASMRATELNMVARYGVFEIDDTYGAPARYEIGAPSTSN